MSVSQIVIPYLSKDYRLIDKAVFATELIHWYETHQRDLPWRQTNDPYKIWLSEIILQQTRVAQGLPYYHRFVEHYPTVEQLAGASEEEVLRLWQGLGYYTRARNLHACAKSIMHQWGGQFPNTYAALLQLHGVGPYTAAAIASIAFKEPVAVVDGNVYRVLARVFGLDEDIASPEGMRAFQALAQSLVLSEAPDLYNQAIMEFGALHCTPARPQCSTCPLQHYCAAWHTKRQHQLPVKSKNIKLKKRYLHYLVLQHEGQLYLKQRKSADIWRGLYDFYLIEQEKLTPIDALEDALVMLVKEHQLATECLPKVYRHRLTHRQLHVCFFYLEATESFMQAAGPILHQTEMRPFSIAQIQDLPKPILIDNFLKEKFYP